MESTAGERFCRGTLFSTVQGDSFPDPKPTRVSHAARASRLKRVQASPQSPGDIQAAMQ